MKHTVYGIFLALLVVMVVAIVLGISGKNVRKNEMETSLNTAIEQSLERLRQEKTYYSYETEAYQELITDFHRLLLAQIESDSELQVDILTADTKKAYWM